MIWDSVLLMTIVDLIIMAAALLTGVVFFRFFKLIDQLNLTIGVALIVLGLVSTALFHLTDLLIMHNIFVSEDNSMSAMTDLHLNWRWYETLLSMGAITTGLTYVASRLLPQVAASMEALSNRNEALEELVEERVAELVTVNQKLEGEIKERADAEKRSRYLAGLVSHVSDAVVSADRDFKLVSWNEGAEKIYGWTADEVMGRDVMTLFQTSYPDGGPPERTRQRYIETGIWKGEAVHTGKDGREIEVFLSSSPILDEAGEMIGAVGVIRDMTEYNETRAALAKERNLMRDMLDNLLDFVYLKDRDGKFILANASLAKYMDVDDPQELIGKTDMELHDSGEAEDFRADELHIMESGQPIVNKYETNTKPETSEQRTVLTTKLPYRNVDGEVIGIIGITRDVTALNEAERLRSEKELLELALDKEKQLSRLKVDFMATVAHEFRTPLTVIMTSSAMLNKYWDRMEDDARRRKLAGIEAQVRHLSSILDEIGMAIEAERGNLKYAPKWVNIQDIGQRVSLEVKPLLDENHSLEMTVPEQTERLYLDSELFCNLVRILVSNAVKYSPEGGPVKVEFMTTTGQLKVAVQDHGIGVPDADKNRLLDPFFRAGNIGTIRGTGSGLSIVKEIVDLHSGSINIESQLDHGTTFTITVPTSRN